MDLISRQAAIDALAEWHDAAITNRLNNLPTVDAVPVRHGHIVKWLEYVSDSFGLAVEPHCKCSECGKEYDPYVANRINFCSNCGAKFEWNRRDGDS